MCDPVSITLAAATIVTAGSQVYAGAAANSQAKYEAKVAEENRKYEIFAREDARKRGDIEQIRHYRAVAQRLGQQRAELAAGGVDVNFGTAADLETDTLMLGYEDSSILAQNNAKEMRGYDINAANYTMSGRAARARGKAAMTGGILSATGTLLSGASQVGKIQQARGVGSSASSFTGKGNWYTDFGG